MSEQHLGDIPAPAKWRHQELNRAYVDASKAFDNDNVLMTHLSLEEKTLLKFADGLEFMIYCLEELRMGNTYAEAPFTRIDMFLNEFLGARGNGVYARAMHNMHQSCRLEYGRTDKEDYA
jgi:5'-deoxynucleotidase YfbR-like HD superfamily hydrolase